MKRGKRSGMLWGNVWELCTTATEDLSISESVRHARCVFNGSPFCIVSDLADGDDSGWQGDVVQERV
jgi:hypothetical protein